MDFHCNCLHRSMIDDIILKGDITGNLYQSGKNGYDNQPAESIVRKRLNSNMKLLGINYGI